MLWERRYKRNETRGQENLRIGFVAAISLAAIQVGVDTRIKLVQEVGVVRTSSVWRSAALVGSIITTAIEVRIKTWDNISKRELCSLKRRVPDIPGAGLVSNVRVTKTRICRAADSTSGASSARTISVTASGSAINAEKQIRDVLTNVRSDITTADQVH
jgi:hypothetical protein